MLRIIRLLERLGNSFVLIINICNACFSMCFSLTIWPFDICCGRYHLYYFTLMQNYDFKLLLVSTPLSVPPLTIMGAWINPPDNPSWLAIQTWKRHLSMVGDQAVRLSIKPLTVSGLSIFQLELALSVRWVQNQRPHVWLLVITTCCSIALNR